MSEKHKVSDELFEGIWSAVNKEIEWRRNTPGVGRPSRWAVYATGKQSRPEGEVAFVEFERIGMNLIERGRQTFVLTGDDDMVKLGPIYQYSEEPIPGREEYCGPLRAKKGPSVG